MGLMDFSELCTKCCDRGCVPSLTALSTLASKLQRLADELPGWFISSTSPSRLYAGHADSFVKWHLIKGYNAWSEKINLMITFLTVLEGDDSPSLHLVHVNDQMMIPSRVPLNQGTPVTLAGTSAQELFVTLLNGDGVLYPSVCKAQLRIAPWFEIFNLSKSLRIPSNPRFDWLLPFLVTRKDPGALSRVLHYVDLADPATLEHAKDVLLQRWGAVTHELREAIRIREEADVLSAALRAASTAAPTDNSSDVLLKCSETYMVAYAKLLPSIDKSLKSLVNFHSSAFPDFMRCLSQATIFSGKPLDVSWSDSSVAGAALIVTQPLVLDMRRVSDISTIIRIVQLICTLDQTTPIHLILPPNTTSPIFNERCGWCFLVQHDNFPADVEEIGALYRVCINEVSEVSEASGSVGIISCLQVDAEESTSLTLTLTMPNHQPRVYKHTQFGNMDVKRIVQRQWYAGVNAIAGSMLNKAHTKLLTTAFTDQRSERNWCNISIRTVLQGLDDSPPPPNNEDEDGEHGGSDGGGESERRNVERGAGESAPTMEGLVRTFCTAALMRKPAAESLCLLILTQKAKPGGVLPPGCGAQAAAAMLCTRPCFNVVALQDFDTIDMLENMFLPLLEDNDPKIIKALLFAEHPANCLIEGEGLSEIQHAKNRYIVEVVQSRLSKLDHIDVLGACGCFGVMQQKSDTLAAVKAHGIPIGPLISFPNTCSPQAAVIRVRGRFGAKELPNIISKRGFSNGGKSMMFREAGEPLVDFISRGLLGAKNAGSTLIVMARADNDDNNDGRRSEVKLHYFDLRLLGVTTHHCIAAEDGSSADIACKIILPDDFKNYPWLNDVIVLGESVITKVILGDGSTFLKVGRLRLDFMRYMAAWFLLELENLAALSYGVEGIEQLYQQHFISAGNLLESNFGIGDHDVPGGTGIATRSSTAQRNAHTHMHTYAHTHIHTYTRTYTRTYTHTRMHPHMQVVRHMYLEIYTTVQLMCRRAKWRKRRRGRRREMKSSREEAREATGPLLAWRVLILRREKRMLKKRRNGMTSRKRRRSTNMCFYTRVLMQIHVRCMRWCKDPHSNWRSRRQYLLI